MKLKELPKSIVRHLSLRLTGAVRYVHAARPVVPVVVSLTSIPERLGTVDLVIRSLLAGTVLPERIVLYLPEELYGPMPSRLSELLHDRFEIRFTPLTCPHKKLIHTLERFPKSVIVTCDDDLMVPRKWLSLLYESHLKHPDCVIANQTRYIRYGEDGLPLPYKQWVYPESGPLNPSRVLAIGAGGVLYPPGSLDGRVQERELFLALCPRADDLWFKVMSLLAGTRVLAANRISGEPIPIMGTKKSALKHGNIDQDANRTQWIRLTEHFGLTPDLQPALSPESAALEEAVDASVNVLLKGGVIVYPTDTVWGIGCDATDPKAVARVYELKQRPGAKALICLVGSMGMLKTVIPDVPEKARELLDRAEKPVTIIYDHPQGIAPNLVGPGDTLAVRIAGDPFCRELLRRFKRPLVSTSANYSGAPTPGQFSEIDPGILSAVDYVVPLERNSVKRTPSSVIRVTADGQVQVIRP